MIKPVENIGYSVKEIEKDIGELGIFHIGVWLGTRNLFPAMYDGYYHVSIISYESFMKTYEYEILLEINDLMQTNNQTQTKIKKLYLQRNYMNLTSLTVHEIENIDNSIDQEKEISNIASRRIEYLKNKLNTFIGY